jgi:tryptophan synthase beta subunit
MHFLVKPLVPARWRVQKQSYISTGVVQQLMLEREDCAKSGGHLTEGTLLKLMIVNTVSNESALKETAARQCILTLASIHTTATTVANTSFDITDHLK